MEGAQGEAQLAELRERWQAANEGAGDWAAITAVRRAANTWRRANGQPDIPWTNAGYTKPEIIQLTAQALGVPGPAAAADDEPGAVAEPEAPDPHDASTEEEEGGVDDYAWLDEQEDERIAAMAEQFGVDRTPGRSPAVPPSAEAALQRGVAAAAAVAAADDGGLLRAPEVDSGGRVRSEIIGEAEREAAARAARFPTMSPGGAPPGERSPADDLAGFVRESAERARSLSRTDPDRAAAAYVAAQDVIAARVADRGDPPTPAEVEAIAQLDEGMQVVSWRAGGIGMLVNDVRRMLQPQFDAAQPQGGPPRGEVPEPQGAAAAAAAASPRRSPAAAASPRRSPAAAASPRRSPAQGQRAAMRRSPAARRRSPPGRAAGPVPADPALLGAVQGVRADVAGVEGAVRGVERQQAQVAAQQQAAQVAARQQQRRDIQQATAAASRGRRRQTVALQAAIRDAATIDDLPPADIARARKNLEDAPLTAAAVAAGSIKLRQVVDEAEARSYETALRQRSAQQQTEGRTGTAGTARLSAAPVLTRFVEDPSQPGARRYRRPRFAGPAF